MFEPIQPRSNNSMSADEIADFDKILYELTNNGNMVIKLNLGCGKNKLDDYVNIDIDPSSAADIIIDIKQGLPLSAHCVDEILLFHSIEHIEEKYHNFLLTEFHRVLKDEAYLYISYPEFKKCATNYINNYKGEREFWKHTIYGLQRSKSDFHVSLMDTEVFADLLQEIGFKDIEYQPEKDEPFNTILRCRKTIAPRTYEDLVEQEIFHSN